MQNLPKYPLKKILIIKNNFIGDTVLTVPFLRNLRYCYPASIINILTNQSSGEFLKYCPYINKLSIVLNNEEGLKNYLNHYKLIKKENYDGVFILKRSFSAALVSFLAGINYRIGFNTDNRGLLLTHKVSYDSYKHEVECFLDILKAVNIPIKDSYLEAWSSENEKQNVDNLLNSYTVTAQKKVIVSASSTNSHKVWPLSNFEKVIEKLTNEYNCQIFFIGLNNDAEIYNNLTNKLSDKLKHPLINLIGKTNVIESVELIKRMNLVIGVDSGIIHLAASVNVPTISIIGPMNDVKWAPYNQCSTTITANISCRPCNLHKECSKGLVCLTNISHFDVIAASTKYLKS